MEIKRKVFQYISEVDLLKKKKMSASANNILFMKFLSITIYTILGLTDLNNTFQFKIINNKKNQQEQISFKSRRLHINPYI